MQPSTHVTWLDILADSVPPAVFDSHVAHAHTLRTLHLRIAFLHAPMIEALTRALTGQALKLTHLSICCEDIGEQQTQERKVLLKSASKWLLAAATLELLEIMVEPRAAHNYPKSFDAIVKAVSKRGAKGMPCRSVWVGQATMGDCTRTQALAAELGVADIVYVW